MTVQATVVDLLRSRGESVATAESLTGGLVCATLVDVPGASDVVRGGIVAYAPDVKTSLVDVPADLIDRVGTVHPDVAIALAVGARARLGAVWGLGTTGWPGRPAEGHPAGTVFVAVSGPDGARATPLSLVGDRAAVRVGAVRAVLEELAARLAGTAWAGAALTPDVTEEVGGTR